MENSLLRFVYRMCVPESCRVIDVSTARRCKDGRVDTFQDFGLTLEMLAGAL